MLPIGLDVKTPQFENPLTAASSAMTLRNLQTQGLVNQQNLQRIQQENEQRQRDLNDEANLTRAFHDAGGDWEKAKTLAVNYNVSPAVIAKHDDVYQQGVERRATAAKADLEAQNARYQGAGAIVGNIIQLGDPDTTKPEDENLRGQAWGPARQRMVQAGYIKPDDPNVPMEYPGIEKAKQLANLGLNEIQMNQLAMDRQATAEKAVATEKAKTEAETAKRTQGIQEFRTLDEGDAQGYADLRTRHPELHLPDTADPAVIGKLKATLVRGTVSGAELPKFDIDTQRAEMMAQFAKDPTSINATIDSLTKDPEQASRYKTLAAMAMKAEGPQGALKQIDALNGELGTVSKETNPAVQAGKEKVAKVEAENRQIIINSGVMPGANGEPSALAKQVANYQIPMSQALARMSPAARESLSQQVAQLNPEFQASNYDTFKSTERAFTSGAPATKANALNTMMGHLSVLNEAADALNNGDIQALNKIGNFFGVQTGKDAVTTYKAIVHRLGPEVTSAYITAGGTQAERGTNEADFDAALGPKQIKSNIGISAQLADSKIKALQDQYKRGTYGRGTQKLISDEAEQARQKLAGQSPVNSAGAGIKVTDPRGTVHTFKTQADAEAFKTAAGIK